MVPIAVYAAPQNCFKGMSQNCESSLYLYFLPLGQSQPEFYPYHILGW